MFGFGARIRESSPEEASAALRESGLLIDVRTPGEFRGGHARGARNIPLANLASRAGELTPQAAVHLICASGNRSRTGARILEKAGFSAVSSVRGGTAAWARAGLKMERG
ncbi:MAG TPA: rhodanese-like domain-containing protein [Candidatus Dormibacteraeota bacterium]|nr:rhodanese-like domain-containing protein [Candidatus Dormibacteraeota bacterium]